MEIITKVVGLNSVRDRCTVYQVIVGQERNVYGGETAAADVVHPSELQECDVLELDCEGSEIDILKQLEIQPRAIILELHPWEYSESIREPIKILQEEGYEILYRYGHDGIELNDDDFETLLYRSSDKKGEKNPDKKGPRYVDSGARWPVVIAAVDKKQYA